MNISNQSEPEARADTRTRLASRLNQLIGLDSIRGRYLLVAGFFVVTVLVASWAAQNIVGKKSNQSTINVTEREQISRQLNDLSDDIWMTETALQSFLLAPDRQQQTVVLGSIDHIGIDIEKLNSTEWSKRKPERLQILKQISTDVAELRRQGSRLMEIRSDAELLFPAMRHMINKMLPNNTNFMTLATLAIDEAQERHHLPSQDNIRVLFSEARYAWSVMVGAFRVFVSNRFGVFPGDPQAGMKNQHQQIEFYHEKVERQLAALSEYEANKQLEFQQAESLSRMRKISREWHDAYLEAAAIYSSERWRADVPLLRDYIHPLFSQMWVGLNVLRGEVESAANTDMSLVTGVAGRLSNAIWIISLITIALTVAGYVFFQYTVLHPIAKVAAALKSEAMGIKANRMQRTTTHETRDLIEAFDHMQNQVRSRQERLQTILDNAAEGIITFDENGRIEGYNQAANRLFGWAEREVIGQNISVLVLRDMQDESDVYLKSFLANDFDSLTGQEGELRGQRKGGVSFPMAIKLSGMWLEGRRLYVALVADNSERKALLENLLTKIEHDDLTGLHNRSYFLIELERVVERAHRSQQVSTLLYIDLDNFKYVNDMLGHLSGDRLLIEVGALLKKRARRSDLIARLGGDEFCMLLYDTRADEAQTIAESFRRALAAYRFHQSSEQVDVGCSIGVTIITSSTQSAEEALSRADFACHLAKRSGRNRVHIFDVKDEANVTALSLDMGWSRRIKDALEHNRFVLTGQPIVDMTSMQISTYEILLRLRDEKGALIQPSGFLPAAERFGLSSDIDRWVIVNAIRMLASQRQDIPNLRYSINLSGQTLSEPAVCDLIIHSLRRAELDPGALTFEVTETVAIANMSMAVSFLSKLREIGCSTALDDFGAGMSSFAYLRELPVDFVKIDGRFVRNLATNATDQAIVRAMNDLAHALGKQTIAEFVEDEGCFQLLREYGVDYTQGYHLGVPDIFPAASENPNSRIVYLKPR